MQIKIRHVVGFEEQVPRKNTLILSQCILKTNFKVHVSTERIYLKEVVLQRHQI